MTRQEMIREGMAIGIYWQTYSKTEWNKATPLERTLCLEKADQLLFSLKQSGMVLKVDTSLPSIESNKEKWKTALELKRDVEKMNLTAWEELI